MSLKRDACIQLSPLKRTLTVDHNIHRLTKHSTAPPRLCHFAKSPKPSRLSQTTGLFHDGSQCLFANQAPNNLPLQSRPHHLPTLREPANECLCSICRRYGALWAYYKPDEVQVEGETEAYIWGKKRLAYNRCKNCGCMTHYSVVKPEETEPRVVVNCRMMEREGFDSLESEQSDGD